MSIEQVEPKHEALSEEEAHHEANMLRAFLSESMEDSENRPTADDYNEAIQAIEELRQETEEQSPIAIRAVIRFNQVINAMERGSVLAGRAIEAAMGSTMRLGTFKELWNLNGDSLKDEWAKVLSDAGSRLKRLQASANEVAAKQTQEQA